MADNPLVKKYLKERITRTLLFNITVSELVKQLNQAAVSQAVGAAVVSGVTTVAQGKTTETLKSTLDSVVKGTETAAQYASEGLDKLRNTAYDVNELVKMMIGGTEAATVGPKTTEFMEAAFGQPMSTLNDNQSSIFDDPSMIRASGTTIDNAYSTLDDLFGQPQSPLRKDQSPITAPDPKPDVRFTGGLDETFGPPQSAVKPDQSRLAVHFV